MSHEIEKIASSLDFLLEAKGSRLIDEVLTYIMQLDENHGSMQELVETVHHHVSGNVEKKMSNLAEKLIQEGELRGKLEGKLEVARNMLIMGSEPVFISKVTGLSLAQIKTLQES